MKAMILAAGYGKRLGNITASMPKCLVEVGGRAIIEYVLSALADVGVNSLVVNLYYLAEQVESFFANNKFPGLNVTLSSEPKLLGTGGGLQKVEDFFQGSDPFIVHNADVYSTINLKDMVTFHGKENALATLAVMKRPTSRALLFDKDMQLSGWRNHDEAEEGIRSLKDPSFLEDFAFCGVQVLSPEIFVYMKDFSPPFSIIEAYMNAAKSGQKVLGYEIGNAYWIDIGKPENLVELRKTLE